MARSKGDGSLVKIGEYWTARVELPPAPDGKRRQKKVRSKNRGTAVQKLRDLRKELDQHGDVITAAPTVTAWCESWLKTTAPERLRPRTLDTYRGYIQRWIIPAIGRVKLSDVTPRHVEAVQELCKTGYGEGADAKKPVSSTTRLQIHRILAVLLRDAVRAGHLRSNPASKDHVEAPRKRHYEAQTLDVAQTRDLLAVVAEHPRAARWSEALFTGKRQAECLGTERPYVTLPETIDPGVAIESGQIEVRWQVQKLKHGTRPDESIPQRELDRGYWMLPPKTGGSFRVVPVITPLALALQRHIDTMPPPTENHDLLYRRADGMPIDQKTDRDEWKDLLRTAELPLVRLHDARHGVATLLLMAGVDIHVIQTILGHSSVLTTRGYAHVNTRLAREGLERMHSLLTA